MPLRQHENLYVFKPEQGTYHPQKTEGHKPYKDDVRKKPKNCGAYGNEIKANPIVNKGERHPTSIIEQKDLGMIEGGYYRGEGKKPFKRMAAHPTERHPTSIIDHENLYVFSDNHITHCKNGKYGTYNPQKTEGKPYQNGAIPNDNNVFVVFVLLIPDIFLTLLKLDP